jgi:hypothetical protein
MGLKLTAALDTKGLPGSDPVATTSSPARLRSGSRLRVARPANDAVTAEKAASGGRDRAAS